MKSFFASFFGAIAALLIIVLILIGIASFQDSTPEIDEGTTLVLRLDGEIRDQPESKIEFIDNILDSPQKLSFSEILLALNAAKKDDRIIDVRIEMGLLDIGYAKIQELRKAIHALESEGKTVSVFAKSYSQKMIYLARAASHVYMAPSGYIEFTGLSSSPLYFKDALDKFGVKAHLIRGSDNIYKSAGEPFIASEMSEANKTQIQERLQSILREIIRDLETDGVNIGPLKHRMEVNPIFSSNDALESGLIDEIRYGWPEGNNTEMTLTDYWTAYELPSGVRKIAVIIAEGDVQDGKGSNGVVADETIIEIIEDVKADKRIGAVVLRINSPGGSAIASDMIWKSLSELSAIKPVVVSMGDIAASGGYYIAAPCNEIYASPTTITGSIGVFGLLFSAEELMHESLGIRSQAVGTNPFSTALQLDQEPSPDFLNLLQSNVDETYSRFKTVVAKGRGLNIEVVDSIARGHVYSGVDAKQLGLIDEFGGLLDAIQRAHDLAGYTDEARIVFYPNAKHPIERALGVLNSKSLLASQPLIEQNPAALAQSIADHWKDLQPFQGIQMRELLFKL